MSSTLSLKLRKVLLDDNETSYSALSYVWGSPIETQQIEINGRLFYITENLNDALWQLHRNGVDPWLWIDAICIQQSDLAEKTHQVGMMRDIFSNAATVYIWLGPGTEEADQAMDLISKYGPRLYASVIQDRMDPEKHSEVELGSSTELAAAPVEFYTKYKENEEVLARGISDILHRHYRCRIWIIQEVALAGEGVVMVGGKRVSLDTFDAALTTMSYGAKHRILGPSGTLYPTKAIRVRGGLRRGRREPLLRAVLCEMGAAAGRPHYAASDPRDLIIGLLGVLDDEEKRYLEADYTQSFGELFTRATRVILRGYPFNLDIVRPGDPEGELPTWVPDFRDIGRYGVRPHPINQGGMFFSAAQGEYQSDRDISVGVRESTLHRRGCVVDEVTEVFQPLMPASGMTDIDISKQWAESVGGFVGLGPKSGPGEDYVWRTVVHGFSGIFRFYWKKYLDGKMHDVQMHGVPQILRKIMRQEPLNVEGLSTESLEFLRGEGMWAGEVPRSVEPVKAEETESLADGLRRRVYLDMSRNSRTLFKTRKGMFGLGHIGIAPGDVVTLVWGVGSPIVLRPRDEGGYYFRGDSYADGIMQGEFLETQPREQELIIH
ncbi:hypothetical protein CBS470a_005141 [Colletotrichum nupharicola]|nr:hypothetical protein CBS470a_005141 [Colletotrichum nupharicola]